MPCNGAKALDSEMGLAAVSACSSDKCPGEVLVHDRGAWMSETETEIGNRHVGDATDEAVSISETRLSAEVPSSSDCVVFELPYP